MARTFSRPIFRRKSRLRLRSILGSALLLLSVGALVAGVFGALYLDHFRPAAVAAAPHAVPAQREDVVAAAAETAQTRPSPLASALAESPPAPPPAATAAALPQRPVEPTAGSSMPPAPAQETPPSAPSAPQAHAAETMMASLPPQPAMDGPASAPPTQIPPAPVPSAAAEPRAASGAYWVEYGAYTTASYAERLRRSLAALGIETTVSYLPGRGGRHYYSVRSAPIAEQAGARAELAKAGEALHIAPLLHRERLNTGEAAVQTAALSSRLEAPAGAVRGRYWVQFGVFAVQRFAERFKARLQGGGIIAMISPRARSDGRTLYYVRSAALPDRESAAALAQRARTLLGMAVLVGRSVTRDKG